MHSTDSGQFPGGDYRIIHRDTNSVLSINLSEGGTIKSRTGAMIEMGGRVHLEGTGKFSMKKLFTGGTIYENTYTGSGLVTLAPVMLGDVQTLRIDGSANWRVGKHGYLAATEGVIKEIKSQGVGKGLLSGGTIYVYHVSGNGLMWVSSFGAIIQREVSTWTEEGVFILRLILVFRFQLEKLMSLTIAISWPGIASTTSRQLERASSAPSKVERD